MAAPGGALNANGALPNIPGPALQAAGAESPTGVGRLTYHLHQLSERRDMSNAAVSLAQLGLASVANTRAATNLAGAPFWFGPAVAAAVAPAVAAAVAPAVANAIGAQNHQLFNESRTSHNTFAFAAGQPQSLRPPFRLGAPPNLPPANSFPPDTQDFTLWRGVGPVRAANNGKVDTLLSFYQVNDPQTGVAFPAASVLAAGVAGDGELVRKHDLLKEFLKGN